MLLAGILVIVLGAAEFAFRHRIARVLTDYHGAFWGAWDPGREFRPGHALVAAVGTTLIGVALVVWSLVTGDLL